MIPKLLCFLMTDLKIIDFLSRSYNLEIKFNKQHFFLNVHIYNESFRTKN